MREITTHKVNGCNEDLKIIATDEPGSGGAHHDYAITFLDERYGFERSPISDRHNRNCIISFQNGPIKEVGTNGVTHEALLAIVADRLEGFQSGPFKCDENQDALDHVKAAMAVLKSRTEKRIARNVEGTHTV